MTIKEVSERTGISIDNLRYYERIGLIPPIPRNKSGIRDYDEIAIHWITFVLKFSIKSPAKSCSCRQFEVTLLAPAVRVKSTKHCIARYPPNLSDKFRESLSEFPLL